MPTTIRKTVTLPSDDVEWFGRTYGDATLSWAMTMMLHEFRQAHEKTPQEYAAIAARELKEDIEEELT